MIAEPALLPEVTVVIPCYNVLPFLEECLRSVQAQDFENWEAVIVDDCSTDGDPGEIVERLQEPRFRLLRHSMNRGLAAARNTGFAAARASYVLPLDSDDVLAPNFLSQVLSLLKSNPALDCAFPQFQVFGKGREDSVREFKVSTTAELTVWQWLPGPGVLMKKALWERTGGYCEAAALRLGNEDWDFWLQAGEVGFLAGHLEEPLYRYRQHGSNMSDTLRAKDHLTRPFLFQRHRALFAQHGTGRSFLAEGFWRSADVARTGGRLWPSLALGLRGWLLDGNWRRLRRLVQNNLRGCFPSRRNDRALKQIPLA